MEGGAVVKRKPPKEAKPVNRRIPRPEAAPGRRVGLGAILVPILIIAILAGGGFAGWKLYLCPQKAVERTMNAFLDAVSEGKYAAAMEFMDTRSKSLFPLDQLASGPMGQQVTRFIPKVKDRKFGTAAIEENRASIEMTATMELTGPQGNVITKTDTQTYYLSKEDGKWKIDLSRQIVEGLKKLPRTALQQMKMFVSMGGAQAAGFSQLIDEALKGK